jgi:5-methylcytosine-specific restriction endonuclease McrA
MKELILIEDPPLTSRAAGILLRRKLIRTAVYHGYQGWLRFRLETLERWQAERGVLTCHYCGRTPLIIDGLPDTDDLATLDHVIPRARGGSHYDLANLVAACNLCNGKKGDKLPEHFKPL